jgi:hypothetical protein
MSYLITKATLNMSNGDKQIIKEKINTPDVEQVRSELHRMHECKSITFVYEEVPENAASVQN